MAASFNLVDEAWIPCLMLGGQARELGLAETLLQAHEIREVFDPSPPVTVALHRLLLAVLHRNFGPTTFAEWKLLWSARRWDSAHLQAYFKQWHRRFDLFDEQRPFYQVPYRTEVKEVHPPAALAQERASGNNATLFDHSFRAQPEPMRPARAACYLLAQQAYAIGGGQSVPFNLSNAPLATGLTVLVSGENLFETLALNLTEYGPRSPALARTDDDLPAWEQEQPAVPDRRGTIPRGRVDYLTWQSRAFHFVAEGQPTEGQPTMVVGCQRTQNLKLADGTLDPFKSYRRDKKEGWKHRLLDPDKAVWRDSHVLLEQAVDTSRRPEALDWLARVGRASRQGEIEARQAYGLTVFGLGSWDPMRPANVTLWREERLPLPLAYLESAPLLERLREALALAESVRRELQQSARLLATRLVAPNTDSEGTKPPRKEVVDTALERLAPERTYWPVLEAPFKRLIVELALDSSEAEGETDYGRSTLPGWARTLRAAAWGAFNHTTNGLDGSARVLKAVAQAEQDLARRLGRTLGPLIATAEHAGAVGEAEA